MLVTSPVKTRYRIFKIPKKSGGERVIHAPTDLVKGLHQSINHNFLKPMQDILGDHVTAYRDGRSIKDAVSRHIADCPTCTEYESLGKTAPKHACPRYGAYIQLDLQDFFSTTSRARVRNYFRGTGYSKDVAGLLAGIFVVEGIPNEKYRPGTNDRKEFCGVPQGSPTAGAICNLVASEIIDKPILEYLEKENEKYNLVGAYKWVYSRYADDLALTCGRDFPIGEKLRITRDIGNIVHTAGYRVNKKKTRVHSSWYRKQMLGLVFNQKPNIAREEYLKVKATVHNCFVHGVESQRDTVKFPTRGAFISYLRGKVAYYTQIMPQKGAKLASELKLAIQNDEPDMDSSCGQNGDNPSNGVSKERQAPEADIHTAGPEWGCVTDS